VRNYLALPQKLANHDPSLEAFRARWAKGQVRAERRTSRGVSSRFSIGRASDPKAA
jgi:hypothetical protein